jgi:phosphoglycolate phosphatase-like HAD superfamily hydrolase
LLEALSRFECKPEDAVFIGDRQSDLDAGIAAGVFTIIVSKNCSHVEHGKFMCVREIGEVQSLLERVS